MSFPVAPRPSSSSSSSMYLMTNDRSTTNSSLSVVSKPSIPAKRAWVASSSSPAKVATIPKKVPKYSTKLDILFIPALLDKIIQYAPNLALPRVNKEFRVMAPSSISHVFYNLFMLPRKLPPSWNSNKDLNNHRQAPIPNSVNQPTDTTDSLENNETKAPKDLSLTNKSIGKNSSEKSIILDSTDSTSIWMNLSQNFQEVEKEYKKRMSLVQCADYEIQDLPYDISLNEFKMLPPFRVYWSEETFKEKQAQLDRVRKIQFQEVSPEMAHVLQQLCYFLPELFSPEVISAMSQNPIEKIFETLKFESDRFFNIKKNQPSLGYLCRYIFEQMLDINNALYYEAFYSLGSFFANSQVQYLSYADLRYLLFIHLHMVLTRSCDLADRNSILKPQLIHFIFSKIKEKKLVLDVVKHYSLKITQPDLTNLKQPVKPDLTNLKQELEHFLSDSQVDRLITKTTKATGMEFLFFRGFSLEIAAEVRIDTVQEIVEKYLSDRQTTSCCVIS